MANGMPPGLESSRLDQCARKRAAYYEALGDREAIRYIDQIERAFYSSDSDSENSNTT